MPIADFLAAAEAIEDPRSVISSRTRVCDMGFDGEEFPEGMGVMGDAEIFVDMVELTVSAQLQPTRAFAAAVSLLLEDVEELEYTKEDLHLLGVSAPALKRGCESLLGHQGEFGGRTLPLQCVSWRQILDSIADNAEMEHFHLKELEALHPDGPPLAMPLCHDGNTRVQLAFVGNRVYYFQMVTS